MIIDPKPIWQCKGITIPKPKFTIGWGYIGEARINPKVATDIALSNDQWVEPCKALIGSPDRVKFLLSGFVVLGLGGFVVADPEAEVVKAHFKKFDL